MYDIHRRPRGQEAGANLHHTSGVSGGHNLCTRIQDGLNLVLADLATQLRVCDAVDPGSSTTFVVTSQRAQLQPGNGLQKRDGLLGNALCVKEVAGGVIGHGEGKCPPPF